MTKHYFLKNSNAKGLTLPAMEKDVIISKFPPDVVKMETVVFSRRKVHQA